MTVSIIIPTYNQPQMLEATVESVLKQTVPPSEIIVVDDGSSDDSLKAVSKMPGIRLVRQSNKGPSAARNTGLELATGDVIASVDHDDLLHPEYLSRALSVLEQSPEAGLSWMNFGTFGIESFPDYLSNEYSGSVPKYVAKNVNARRSKGDSCVRLTAHESRLIFSQFGPLSNSALVYRRSALKGWNPRLRILDDLGAILNATLCHSCAAVMVLAPSWSKRIGEHNSSRLGDKLAQAVADWGTLVDQYCPVMDHKAAAYHRKSMADLQLSLGFHHSENGRTVEALKQYRNAFQVVPSIQALKFMLRAIARNVVHKAPSRTKLTETT